LLTSAGTRSSEKNEEDDSVSGPKGRLSTTPEAITMCTETFHFFLPVIIGSSLQSQEVIKVTPLINCLLKEHRSKSIRLKEKRKYLLHTKKYSPSRVHCIEEMKKATDAD
jgi:hypothetical protein